MSFKVFPASIESEKVVFASEMARVEHLAIEEGDSSGAEYMEKAADGIFQKVAEFISNRSLAPKVILLCGKGNNGGDAFSVGIRLLKADFEVIAIQIAPLEESSELCQKHAKLFEKGGGEIVYSFENIEFTANVLVIDGLLGTGFQGVVKEPLATLIEKVNASYAPVLSIDIPSGVDGNKGVVEKGAAIYADLTLYLGRLKVGHLFNGGFEHVGDLERVDFGMGREYVNQLAPFAYLVNPQIAVMNLASIKRTANKYSVGEVLVVGGAPGMPGASQLASYAALRSGAGIVRLYYQKGVEVEFSGMWPEVIRLPYTFDDLSSIYQEFNRAKALLVGPGLGRDGRVVQMLNTLYQKATIPVVIDADALTFFQEAKIEGAVLTPHEGELRRLLNAPKEMDQITLIEKAEAFAIEHKVTIVCKGAPTTVVSNEGKRVIILYGNKGMASGGMGDALAGIIASMIAQGKSPREGAILGATIHAIAGDKAKSMKSERSMIASDLIESLPQVFQDAME